MKTVGQILQRVTFSATVLWQVWHVDSIFRFNSYIDSWLDLTEHCKLVSLDGVSPAPGLTEPYCLFMIHRIVFFNLHPPLPRTVRTLLSFTPSLEGRPGISDVSPPPPSGISGLSFDSTLLSPLLVFLAQFCYSFCLILFFLPADPFFWIFPENSSICFRWDIDFFFGMAPV